MGVLQVGSIYATYKHHLETHDMQPHICRAGVAPATVGVTGTRIFVKTQSSTPEPTGEIWFLVELRFEDARGFGGGGYDRKAAVARMLYEYPDNDALVCVHSASLAWEEAC